MAIRRHLGRLLLGLAAIALAIPASASATTINAGALNVFAYSTSGLDAGRDSHNLFYSSSYSGFFVRFADGPLADRTYGHSWGRTNTWTAVSESAPTRDGTTQTAETVYAARNGTADVVRVQQTVRVVDNARTFRVTYRVQNMTDQPLRYRALTGGEIKPGGSSSGYGRTLEGPPRFLGAESSGTGIRAGVEEVRSSRLASDDAAVAVPAWAIRRAADFSTVGGEISIAAGPPNTVLESLANKAVAVAWEDHLAPGAALEPGASARYEVVWRVTEQPGLSLSTNSSSRYLGAQSVLSGRLADAAAQAIGGASIRWSITGANPTDAPGQLTTAADGDYSFTYVGTAVGTDTITVWADSDGDGAQDAGEPQRVKTVGWSAPPPQIVIEQPYSQVVRVGNAINYQAILRNAIGEPLAGKALRWKVTGVNPTAGEQTITTAATGYASLQLTATLAGTDVLEMYADQDGDSEQDADEPHAQRTITWAPPPPPISIESYSSSNPRVTQNATTYVRVYDDVGVVAKNAGLIWSVAGVNPRAASTARTNSYGEATISYQGTNVGVDTLSVGHDRNGDGELGAGEPVKTHTVTFRQAAPPPITTQTLDAEGLNVSVTSVGGVQARFDGETRDVFENSGYTGFYLRVLDGPLAGKSYSTTGYDGETIEPFYGDPQTAPTRSGSEIVQRGSWRVRVNDKDVLRVHQIARLSDGASSFRLTWRVENLTDTAMRLRAGHLGDMSIDGRETGAPVVLASPRRFVGIASNGGLAAGVEAVTASRLPEESTSLPVADWTGYELAYPSTLAGHLGSLNGLPSSATTPSDAAAVQWSDHAAEGQGLGAGSAARYEVLWRLRKPLALRLSPPSDVAETRHEHSITATLLDDAEQPANGTKLRWSITGANPRTGSASTTGLGQVVIAWTGSNTGQDTVTVYADHDDDGVRDPDEPQRTATVTWRLESAVDPPVFAPLLAPNGTTVNVNLQSSGADQFLEITPSQASLFSKCGDGSGAPQVNLGLSVNVNAAAGAVVAGSMALLSVNVATGNLLQPIASTLPTGVAVDGNFKFVLNCLHTASLVLCYELQEGLLPIERFCVVLGGIGLWDPAGRVYDATEYDGLVAAGCTPTMARAKSALTGAEVVLHRKHDGAFRRVLSGDPFVTPNVNPFVTEADGRYGWNVSAGTYRVVVSRSGYETATSREAVVPPPDLELNVGLRPTDAPEAPSADELAEREAFCDTPDPSPPPPPPPPPPAEDPPSPVIPPPPPAVSNPPSLSLAQILALLSMQSHATTPPDQADVRAGKMKVDRKGRLRLRLSCPAGTTTCAGQVMVVATKPTQLVAKKAYAIKGGRAKTVTLRISSKVRRQARSKAKRQLLVVAEQQNRVFTLGKPRFSG